MHVPCTLPVNKAIWRITNTILIWSQYGDRSWLVLKPKISTQSQSWNRSWSQFVQFWLSHGVQKLLKSTHKNIFNCTSSVKPLFNRMAMKIRFKKDIMSKKYGIKFVPKKLTQHLNLKQIEVITKPQRRNILSWVAKWSGNSLNSSSFETHEYSELSPDWNIKSVHQLFWATAVTVALGKISTMSHRSTAATISFHWWTKVVTCSPIALVWMFCSSFLAQPIFHWTFLVGTDRRCSGARLQSVCDITVQSGTEQWGGWVYLQQRSRFQGILFPPHPANRTPAAAAPHAQVLP